MAHLCSFLITCSRLLVAHSNLNKMVRVIEINYQNISLYVILKRQHKKSR